MTNVHIDKLPQVFSGAHSRLAGTVGSSAGMNVDLDNTIADKVNKAIDQYLARQAFKTMSKAKARLKKGRLSTAAGRKRKERNPSAPGKSPRSWSGKMRGRIRYEKEGEGQYIVGPELTGDSVGSNPATAANEYGGTAQIRGRDQSDYQRTYVSRQKGRIDKATQRRGGYQNQHTSQILSGQFGQEARERMIARFKKYEEERYAPFKELQRFVTARYPERPYMRPAAIEAQVGAEQDLKRTIQRNM